MVIISERLLLWIVYSVMTWTVSRFCDSLPPAPTRICLLDCDSLPPALIFACIVNALYSPLRLFVCAALLFNKLHMDPQSTDSSLQLHSESFVAVWLCMITVQLEEHGRAMWSLKISWSSKIAPRFLTELDGVIVKEPSWMVKLCCIVGVAGKTKAQSLPGWAVGDVLSSMPRCPPGSLRSVQLPLDHLVEMRDRAVCHQCRNGRRSHVPVWWEPVM